MPPTVDLETALPELDGFRIHRRIGAGGSGSVFEATQLSLGRRVAVKILFACEFDDPQARARFVREAQVQASLSHPNLLALYDYRLEGGQAFLVTELLAGGSLRDRIQSQGRLRLPELLRFGSEMASAIACAHAAGIVHRDLKPETVLITEAGHVKVADFGLARQVEGGAALTSAGTVMGTPGYMGPEVLDHVEAAPALDIYALGVILFEMAAGSKPFGKGSVAEILCRQSARAAPLVRTLRPELPESFEAIVRQCLERAPAARPTAAQVAERLAGLSNPQKDRRSPASRPPQIPAASGRGRQVGPFLLAAAVLALGAGFWLRAGSDAPKVSHAPSTPPPRATVRPQEPPVPEVAAVSTGPDRATLRLSGPAPAGLRLAYSRNDEEPRSEEPVPAGVREFSVGGLIPASRYRFQLTGGGRGQLALGRTLAQDRGISAFWLDRRPAREVDVACGGGRIGLLWRTLRKLPQEALFTESDDDGRTWSEPAALAASAEGALSIPCLTRVKTGLLTAWTTGRKPAQTRVRFRADGDSRWRDLGEFEGAQHAPLLISGGGWVGRRRIGRINVRFRDR